MQAIEELNKARSHLRKAIEELKEMPKSAGIYRASRDTIIAATFSRYALEQLREESEEEPCKS